MVFGLNDSLAKLPLPATTKWPHGVWDVEAFKHGSMSLIVYHPHVQDFQTTHDQDELYIVGELGFGGGRVIVQVRAYELNRNQDEEQGDCDTLEHSPS